HGHERRFEHVFGGTPSQVAPRGQVNDVRAKGVLGHGGRGSQGFVDRRDERGRRGGPSWVASQTVNDGRPQWVTNDGSFAHRYPFLTPAAPAVVTPGIY